MNQQQKLQAALVKANVLSADARPKFAKACVDSLLALGVRVIDPPVKLPSKTAHRPTGDTHE